VPPAFWHLTHDALAITDADGVVQACNPAWTRHLGWHHHDMRGRLARSLVHPGDLHRVRRRLVPLPPGNHLDGIAVRLRHANGAYVPLTWSITTDGTSWFVMGRPLTPSHPSDPLPGQPVTGTPQATVPQPEPGAAEPQSPPQSQAQPQSAGTSDFWQAAIDSLQGQIAVLNHEGDIVAVNEAWRRFATLMGRETEDVGTNYLTVCDAGGSELTAQQAGDGIRRVLAGEEQLFTLDYRLGESWYSMRATPFAGVGTGVVVSHTDVTEQRRAETDAAAARSYLGAVTASMGEGLFVLDHEGRVQMMNPRAERLLGWSFDRLAGQRMHDLTHYRDANGNDLPRSACPILAAYRDGQLVRVLEDTFVRRDGSSLPVAYTAAPLETPDGRSGCVVVFMDATGIREEEQRLRDQVEALSWLRRVEDALAEDRLLLYEQPIVDLRTGEVVQRELLLRVRETDGSIALPTPYLVAAERHGLIGDIDRWVVRQAVAMAAAGAPVEVNVSAASLSDARLLAEIERSLADSGADPGSLVLEITETAIVEDEAAASAFVHRLHQLGCAVALDDFGTGYGGFTYLKHLPVDFLKIDREFVRDLQVNDASRHVVQAVVNLAHGFGLHTVAEGVEDQVTLDLLVELGVDLAQGYHLGRPAPTGPEV
jgi:PAS domain S-box-containing protein